MHISQTAIKTWVNSPKIWHPDNFLGGGDSIFDIATHTKRMTAPLKKFIFT
jgi:hypothetical protein